MRFQVVIVMKVSIVVFCAVSLCGFVSGYQPFRGNCIAYVCRVEVQFINTALLKMEATCSSEILVMIYKIIVLQPGRPQLTIISVGMLSYN
jgi:hypothetical protein